MHVPHLTRRNKVTRDQTLRIRGAARQTAPDQHQDRTGSGSGSTQIEVAATFLPQTSCVPAKTPPNRRSEEPQQQEEQEEVEEEDHQEKVRLKTRVKTGISCRSESGSYNPRVGEAAVPALCGETLGRLVLLVCGQFGGVCESGALHPAAWAAPGGGDSADNTPPGSPPHPPPLYSQSSTVTC